MFTVQQIETLSNQRMRILRLAGITGIVALFAWFLIAGVLRYPLEEWTRRTVGESVADFVSIALMAPAFLVLLAPFIRAERRAEAFSIVCPACKANLSQRTRYLLLTKCCSACKVKVVEGGPVRSPQVFKRWQRRNIHRFLAYWLWTWPALGLIVFSIHWFDPAGLANCRNWLFIPGTFGTATSGWAYARTRDGRYLSSLVVSIAVFGVGAFLFW